MRFGRYVSRIGKLVIGEPMFRGSNNKWRKRSAGKGKRHRRGKRHA